MKSSATIEQQILETHTPDSNIEPFTYSEFAERYFAREIGLNNLKGIRFLDIGFGQGGLLKWAHDHGATAYGLDIRPGLVEAGRHLGLQTFHPDDFDWYKEQFDIIIAFDVFEHTTFELLSDLLMKISASLSPNGRLIAKFPNGQSPFGRVLQYATYEHVQVVSVPRLQELIIGQGLPIKITLAREPVFVLDWDQGPLYCAAKTIQHWFRRSLFAVIAGIVGLPNQMDPNIVVEIRRKGAES